MKGQSLSHTGVHYLNRQKIKIMKDIYKLELHEFTEVNTGGQTPFYVVRVPGGWLCTIYRLDSNAMTTTFIPLDQ